MSTVPPMAVGVLQARLGSTRLAGKALLPLAGMPAAVLAARRAANRGLPVRVATSLESCDDVLVHLFEAHGIQPVRGPLDDVLKRFTLATHDLPDTALVVRLTADNVFPDGAFIEELIQRMQQDGRRYLGVNWPADGLPYGMSAEVMTVAALREADAHATSAFDREHVTPWIRRQGLPAPPRTSTPPSAASLRCTLDSFADYERLAQLFDAVPGPVLTPWQELCDRLAALAPRPRVPLRVRGGRCGSEFVLGTAQLGLAGYGRTNLTGRPAMAQAIEMVRRAVEHGVDCLDTARAYDLSERVIGRALRPYGDRVQVVTKLSPLPDLPDTASAAAVRQAVDASVFRSCRELGMARLPVLLLHRWAHRLSHGGAVWQRLLELQAEGVLGRLGASVSTPAEAGAALAEPQVAHLQLPFNLLDYRWQAPELEAAFAARPDVVVHARSIFLQGLLAAGPEAWPRVAGVVPERVLEQLDEWVRRLRRKDRLDLCVAFARSQPWVDALVLGAETAEQLLELIDCFDRPALNLEEAREVRRSLPEFPENLLNPALWPSS